MTIKIICNGNIKDIVIIDLATGAQLQSKCTKAHIILDAAHRPEAILHFTDVSLEVVADVIKTIPPTKLTPYVVRDG